jgi:hypothetical protein
MGGVRAEVTDPRCSDRRVNLPISTTPSGLSTIARDCVTSTLSIAPTESENAQHGGDILQIVLIPVTGAVTFVRD